MLLALGIAAAACSYTQTTYADRVEVLLRAGAGHVPCRTVAVSAAAPFEVEAWIEGDGRRRVRRDDLRRTPDGGWEVLAPSLVQGELLRVHALGPPKELVVGLGPWTRLERPGASWHEVRTVELDGKHPGWGFADPTLSRTRVVGRWSDGAPETERVVPGAAAQGAELLGPGSLELHGPDVAWVAAGGEGVTVTRLDDGVRFDAPAGGLVRWRVAAVGEEPVIPDEPTFLAGLEWRFRLASLPEPAVPVRLKAERDRDVLLQALYDEVRSLVSWSPPRTDPLAVRQLNRAWRSGHATPIEAGLILQRMLGQERFPSSYVLTGADPEPTTWTGYDQLLLRVLTADGERWLDPGCAVCSVGEVDPQWMGRPALGGAEVVPRAPGKLVRRVRIEGSTYLLRFEASGAAATWLRERVAELDLPRRAERLLPLLGVREGATVAHTPALVPGGDTLQDATLLDGEDVVIEVRTTRAPQDPPVAGWDGGWEDVL